MPLFDLVFFVVGIGALMAGAEGLVRGSSRLAQRLGIPPIIVGLTIVAFGTSSPETAVSVQSAWTDQADIALGNIVGSNITNVLLILGLSALVAPLMVSARLVRLDVPLMIAVSVLTLLLCADGELGRFDGFLLLVLMAGYLAYLIVETRWKKAAGAADVVEALPPMEGHVVSDLLWSAGGLVLLVIGSRWLVNGAVIFAEMLGVSKLVIGLTVVAVGTSLPELATSVMAAFRGERDIAVGNVVGSNLFNLMFVLGLAAVVAPRAIAISPAALHFDLPVMVAVAVACLPVFFNGNAIERWEGGLFFAYYLAYVAYLVLSSTRHASLPLFNWVMLAFALPLTAVTLAVISWRAYRKQALMRAEAGAED